VYMILKPSIKILIEVEVTVSLAIAETPVHGKASNNSFATSPRNCFVQVTGRQPFTATGS